MSNKNEAMFQRTRQYIKPYRIPYVLYNLLYALGLFFLFTATSYLLRVVVQCIQAGGISDTEFHQLFLYVAFIVVLSPLSGLGTYGISKIEKKIQSKIRLDMIHSITNCDERTIESYQREDLHNRVYIDAKQMTEWLLGSTYCAWITQPIITGGMCLVMLLIYDPIVCLIAFVLSILNLYITRIFTKKRSALNQKVTETQSESLQWMRGTIDGAIEIRFFHLSDSLSQIIAEKLTQISKNSKAYQFYSHVRSFLVQYYGDCLMVVTFLILGSYLSSKDLVSFANVIFAIPLSDQIMQMITAFGTRKTFIEEQAIHEERVYEILDFPQQPHTQKEAEAIQFEHVSFSYDDKPVLHDISFVIQKNTKVAIVGESGSGKSTITKILLGLYQPNEGMVALYQNNSISYMPQSTSLFHDSVAGNISLSCDPDLEKIDDSIHQANCTFIQEKENGVNFVVQDNQKDFSGGEIQRIALARNIYSNRDLWILDEPTSSLDSSTTLSIKNVLNQMEDKTIVAITHNLVLTSDFDQIIVLKDGRIAEQGTHESLLKNHSCYYDMWQKQHTERVTE